MGVASARLLFSRFFLAVQMLLPGTIRVPCGVVLLVIVSASCLPLFSCQKVGRASVLSVQVLLRGTICAPLGVVLLVIVAASCSHAYKHVNTRTDAHGLTCMHKNMALESL